MAGSDTFQKLKSSVNRGITTISVKSASALEKTKLKTHIDTLNKEIEKDFTTVGLEAYRLWLAGGTDFSSLFAKYESIKNKHEQIDALNKEISSIDERDNQILGNAATSVEEPAADKPTRHFCSKCGAPYDAPVKFCRKCGNKMAD